MVICSISSCATGPISESTPMAADTKAVIDVWGADRVGYRISPNGAFNSMSDSNPLRSFSYLAEELNRHRLSSRRRSGCRRLKAHIAAAAPEIRSQPHRQWRLR
jgi:2,4-dienoyl-CoA reductase-like NADH-dependent reductase (Old Yellow Enzyme family)